LAGNVKVGERVRNAWQELRARSIYFQLKLLVVLAYGLVVFATVVAARPEKQVLRNDLGARVMMLPGDPIVGRYLIVQNESRKDWLGVRFEIDGGYQARRDAVLAGEKLTLYVRDFTRHEVLKLKRKTVTADAKAPASLVPTLLRIETKSGVMVQKLAGP
jgi:hypothetical protein